MTGCLKLLTEKLIDEDVDRPMWWEVGRVEESAWAYWFDVVSHCIFFRLAHRRIPR
jgi:hypothetical protein